MESRWQRRAAGSAGVDPGDQLIYTLVIQPPDPHCAGAAAASGAGRPDHDDVGQLARTQAFAEPQGGLSSVDEFLQQLLLTGVIDPGSLARSSAAATAAQR